MIECRDNFGSRCSTLLSGNVKQIYSSDPRQRTPWMAPTTPALILYTLMADNHLKTLRDIAHAKKHTKHLLLIMNFVF